MFLFLLLLPFTNALSIHHRLFHPKAPSLEYTLRAHVAPDLSITRSSSFADEIPQHLLKLQDLDLDFDSIYYQVALQRDGDQSDVQWDFSSVKLCHLYHATSETIILYSKEMHAHAIDYFVSPVPHNGACPKPKGKKSRGTLHATFPPTTFNTTIITETYGTPSLPELRAPPPLTTEGKPVQPVSEKTFLQKYWMYIVPLLILTLISGGQEDDQQRRRA
ncbi:hypothetical protein AX15_002980 [Amanita polypyramis BW_CC]|nr:hypothetical protein AX15_002980 [Amanita polypyramis BW_CC]